MDYLATMQKMNFGAHGYASNFCISIFDREWKVGSCSPLCSALIRAKPIFPSQKNLTLDEGIEIMRKCKKEVETRFLVAQPKFKLKVVDKNGVRELDYI